MKENNEHPEVTNIKNICEVLPKTKITKDVCEKINNEKHHAPNQKNHARKKTSKHTVPQL